MTRTLLAFWLGHRFSWCSPYRSSYVPLLFLVLSPLSSLTDPCPRLPLCGGNAGQTRAARRHWPVVVMAVSDLTRAIACGGSSTAPGGPAFPLGLAEASPTGKPEEAYPVMVMGTQVLPWPLC